MVAASKVTMLKLNNGASLPKTQVMKGVTTVIPITSIEDKAQRRQKDAKQLLEVVEKRFGGNAAIKKTQRILLQQQYENITSDQDEEGPNYALMTFTSVSSDSNVSTTCSKTCLETVNLPKSQNEQLIKDLKKSELKVIGYKSSLKSVEERLKFFKKNKSIYLEDIKVLKVEIQMKEIAIIELRRKLEAAQKEKDEVQLTLDKLENASKSLNKLIDCHIVDNCKKDLRYESYNAVPPPYTGNFMLPKHNLSFTNLDEFADKPVAENTKSSEEETKTRNKADLETMSMDDLYNNLKVHEPEVKGMSSSNSSTQNMAFMSSSNNSSINRAVNTAQAVNTANGVSTANTQVNVAFSLNIDYLSDASDQAEEGPNYALMTFTSLSSDSNVSTTCSKTCLETVNLPKSHNEQLIKDLKKSELMVIGYKSSLKSVEERLKFFKKNKSIYLEDIKVLKVEIQMKEIAIIELRRKLKVAQKEKDGVQLTLDKLENASKSLNKLIDCQIVDNCKKDLRYESYNAVPPPYIGNFMLPKHNLSFTNLDEFADKPVAENTKSSEEETKTVRKNSYA
nr:hypothetical protein [Tanacetum cinerariifolium]